MPAIRVIGRKGLAHEEISGGDTLMLGEAVGTVATVGATTIPAAALVGGVLFRSGSTAIYTDTLDTAANILTALSGNLNEPAIVVGNTFRLRMINSVAFIQTLTLGAGMVAGVGAFATVPASSYRDFLLTFQSVQEPVAVIGATTSGSPTILFPLPVGTSALPMGVAPNAVNIQPGCSVTGTGIPANTTVVGLVQGQGGIIGVTLSANATATAALGVMLTFGPTIRVDGLGSGTL